MTSGVGAMGGPARKRNWLTVGGFVLLVLGILVSGLWVAGRVATEYVLTEAVSELRSDGVEVQHSGFSTRGFPLQLVTETQEISLAPPGGRWISERVALRQQLWRPGRFELSPGNDQILRQPPLDLEIRSDDTLFTLHLKIADNAPLREARAEAVGLTVTDCSGARLSLAEGYLEATETGPLTYAITSDIRDLTLPTPAGVPGIIDSATLSARILAPAPWDRMTLLGSDQLAQEIEIEAARVLWDDMIIDLSGTLQVDPQGWPEGRLALRLTNWARMLEIASDTGWLTPELAAQAQVQDTRQPVELPLIFRDQSVFLGFFRLGSAPNLSL